MTLRRAVFLDRDGVLNRSFVRNGKPYAPHCLDEIELYDDVSPALKRAKEAGFVLICCTNQPDVGRGLVDQKKVEEINQFLQERLGLDAVEVCFSGDDADRRRKPNEGMLVDAAKKLGIDLPRSFMIGDRWRDVEAGRRAGCCSILIDRGYQEAWPVAAAENVVSTLTEAIDRVLED